MVAYWLAVFASFEFHILLREHVMKNLKSMVQQLVRDERGLETVEYAIIAALITGSAILAITSLGTAVAAKFNTLVTELS
jgi:Flp pilus assembly pilin Flp